jgi:hypothetical protein
MACWALGDDHSVAQRVIALADANISEAAKRAVLAKQRRADEVLAERALADETTSRERSDKLVRLHAPAAKLTVFSLAGLNRV